MQLRPDQVQHQIANLMISYPELSDDPILRADMIEGATNLHELLTQLVETREDAKASIVGIKSRTDDLGQRKARMERRKEAAEQMIFKLMELAGEKKIPLPVATLSIGAARAKVIVTDESLIPDAYCVSKREPKKSEIKDALDRGEAIAGCELSNGGEQLSIRVK